MSEVIHNAPQEFWQPPVISSEPASETLAGACERCGTEFMVGARFCHVCGASRPVKAARTTQHSWVQALEVLKVLEFHRVREWFALSTASFISFLIGLGCLLATIMVGILYSVQNLADFQAIQLWRIEWLLAALASFAAGILLKR
jgi:ribosomal protein L37E